MGSTEPRTAVVTSSCHQGQHQAPEPVQVTLTETPRQDGVFRKTPKLPKKAYLLNETYKAPNSDSPEDTNITSSREHQEAPMECTRHPISSTAHQDQLVSMVSRSEHQKGTNRVVMTKELVGVQVGNMRPPSHPPPSTMRPPPPPAPPHHGTKGKEKQNQEEPSSSIPDLEFDGTTVLCRVCGDKASGFHYGVHSCEGCKGFFRRSIQQKIQYRPCTKNQQCSILRINRNRCQYCRLRKCIAVGMSRDAVRFGRVPKREKARILAAMQLQSKAASSSPQAASSAARPEAAKEEEPKEEEEEEAKRLAETVLRAHSDTCHFAHLRPKEGAPRPGTQVYSVQGRNGPILACPLNPRRPLVAGLSPDPRAEDTVLQDFSQRFSPAIRGVVEFAKRIPGFALLSQSDQVTLLKAGVFEVLLLRLACLFDAQTNTMTCLNGELLRRESIVAQSPSSSPSQSPSHSSNARFLVDSMFEFAARLNALQLSDAELALFSAVVIIAPDRPGLRHTDLISRIHSRLLSSLSLLLSRNHPTSLLATLQSYIPDLRTLNTLHSEKLLAFKMTEQQNQSAEEQRVVVEEQEQYARAQGCPAHAMQVQPEAWKDAEEVVHEVEDEEIIEDDVTWRQNQPHHRSSTISATMCGVKSPLGSVSSSESICSGEVAALTEFRSNASTSAPLLAASLSGGVFPKRRRHRDRSGSNSEEDSVQGGLACPSQAVQMAHRTYFRKLDSPSDSGIESGTERLEKSSTSTSVCSSPRSSLEDKEEVSRTPRRCPHAATVEDMPVLKRVLQAPPLYDTNSLMDEAYKPHKKFRALRKDCAEEHPVPEARVAEKTPYATLEPVRMETEMQSPPVVVLSPPASSPQSIISTLNMHFPQITIHAQPMRNPSPTNNSPNPPLLLQKALLQPPANQRCLQTQQHQALLSALSADPPSTSAAHSSLSSTHSTLARSLMDAPKLTAEQMKRTDIIHSYIMREGAEEYRKPYQPPKTPEQRKEGVLVFNGSYVHWNKQNNAQEELKQDSKQPLNLSKKTPPPSPAATQVGASMEA